MLRHFDTRANELRILEGERLFLAVLLTIPRGIATLAQATEPQYLTRPYEDGGRWRGSIPKRLAGRGLVGAVSFNGQWLESQKSIRTSRRGGIATVWRLLDVEGARRRLRDLDATLDIYRATRSRQPSLFDDVVDDDSDSGLIAR